MTDKGPEVVFISYAHDDNDENEYEEGAHQAGWVSRVNSILRRKLKPRIGKKIDTWMDPKIGPNEKFPDVIKKAIDKVPLFLIVLSPCYLESFWCRQERERFISRLGDSDFSNRVFVIQRYVIDEEQEKDKPQELKEYSPQKFYKEQDDGYIIFGEDRTDTDMTNAVRSLANRMSPIIKARLRENEENDVNEQAAPKNAPTLMLGRAKGDELKKVFTNIQTFVEKLNFKNRPLDGYYGCNEHSKLESITQEIRESDLFLQIIGEKHWSYDPDYISTEAMKDLDVAIREGLPVLVYSLVPVPETVEFPADSPLSKVKSYEFNTQGITEFLSTIKRHLQKIESTQMEPSANYFLLDKGDAPPDVVTNLTEKFREEEMAITSQSGDDGERRFSELCLKDKCCTAILTVFDGSDSQTLRKRIEESLNKFNPTKSELDRKKYILINSESATKIFSSENWQSDDFFSDWKIIRSIDEMIVELPSICTATLATYTSDN